MRWMIGAYNFLFPSTLHVCMDSLYHCSPWLDVDYTIGVIYYSNQSSKEVRFSRTNTVIVPLPITAMITTTPLQQDGCFASRICIMIQP